MARDALGRFTVSLEDKMSGPSKAAADGLSKLEGVASKAKSGLDTLTGGLIKVQEPTETMRGALDSAAAGMKAFVGAVAAGDAKGAIEGLGESLAGVATMLDLVYPGLGQVASAVIKLTTGVAGLTAGLIQQGIAMSISATQGKQAMIGMFDALGAGVTKGAEVEEMLGDLSTQTGLTKDALAPLTKSFMAMGVQGVDALKKMTLAAASAQAIMGDPSAASAFEALTKKIQTASQTGQGLKIPLKGLGSLADMGLTVDDVAKKMNVSAKDLADQLKAGSVDAAKFGVALQDALITKGKGPLDRMSMSLDNMKKQFSQAMDDLFEDIQIEDFLKEVKSLFAIFGQGTESGKALKAGIGGAFNFIFSVMAKVIPPIKHFLLDVVIWSLKAYIFIKQHWTSISNTLKGVGVVLAVIGTTIAIAMAIALAPMLLLIAAITLVVVGIGWLIGKVMELGPAAIKAAKDFIDGMIKGITDGVGMVVDAAKNLAGSAISAVKGVLGISSPSKVLMGVGANTAEGMTAGMDAGAGDVASSGAAMGAAAAGGAMKGASAGDYGGGGGGGAGGGGAGGGMSTGPITVNVTAPGGITHAQELTEIGLAAVMERLMLQRGGGAQPA